MSISGGAGADILSQLINGVTRNLLPQGHDHSGHAPTEALQEGRIDVIISHAIAGQIAGAHPIVQAMYGGARAVLDGALTAVAGPVAIEGIIRRRISPKFLNIVNTVGFVLLMILMVLVTYQDIVKLFNEI